jgi:hypothetical protein
MRMPVIVYARRAASAIAPVFGVLSGTLKKDPSPPIPQIRCWSIRLPPNRRRIALLFLSTRVMNGHDRSPVRRNEMNSTASFELAGLGTALLAIGARLGGRVVRRFA